MHFFSSIGCGEVMMICCIPVIFSMSLEFASAGEMGNPSKDEHNTVMGQCHNQAPQSVNREKSLQPSSYSFLILLSFHDR